MTNLRRLLLITMFLASAAWLMLPGHPWEPLGLKILNRLHQIVIDPLAVLLSDTFGSPVFYIVLAGTLMLERFIPAHPNGTLSAVSRLQDFIWMIYESILHAAVVVTFTASLYGFYDHYFRFMTLDVFKTWPEWSRFVLAVLVQDFSHYAQHYIHHKVPWLWQLHAVHHSQKDLNFFTDFRYHVLEYVLREFFLVVPFLVLGIPAPAVVYYAIFRRFYTHFYHANIRSNLGPLRYVLVTPQSHRIHHSYAPAHWDRNFGSMFVFWDFIFGTQYKGWDEYPPTGIPDEAFPHERRGDPASLLATPVLQMLHPFKMMGRDVASVWHRLTGKRSAEDRERITEHG